MNINLNIVSLIDVLGLVQGVLIGFFLVFSSRKSRPSLLLGLFLITYAAEMSSAILTDTGIMAQKPILIYLPLNFYCLSVPLFYLYVISLTSAFSLRKYWVILLPGVIEFLVFLTVFLLSESDRQSLLENCNTSQLDTIYFYFALMYAIYFAVLTIRHVNRYQKSVLNYFSNIEKRKLEWVKMVAIFILAYHALWFIPVIVPFENILETSYPILSIINVAFIYWVGMSGYSQLKVEMLVEPKEETVKLPSEQLPLDEREPDVTYQKLLDLMEQQMLFKDPDLTLPALASQMNMDRRSLSRLINQKSKDNFNQFINHYRVEEAKKILSNPAFNHLNMLGVAFEVGFSSKATFFSVFKKKEDNTPAAYKKQHS